MNLHARSLLLLAVAIAQAYGAIYENVSQLPTYAFDYIIVGGTSHHTTNQSDELTYDRC